MKEFTTAAREAPASALDGAEALQFTLDGKEMTIYPPTPGQIALIMHAQTSGSTASAIASVIDFVDAVLDKDGSAYFRERLLSRDDDFDIENVQEILDWAMEEWAGRPTE